MRKITECFELKTGGKTFENFDEVLAFSDQCKDAGISSVEVIRVVKIEEVVQSGV